MGICSKVLLIQQALLLCMFVAYATAAVWVSDYSALVYKSCGARGSAQSESQILDSLLTQLVAQSRHWSFFKSMEVAGDDDDSTMMRGVFQCREDISREECFGCVNLVAQMMRSDRDEGMLSLCRAARVQLEGCYAHYETHQVSDQNQSLSTDDDEVEEVGVVVQHKECAAGDTDHEVEVMERALEALESGIENGYYRGINYDDDESVVEMMAQCEGDLDACECRECVSHAVQVAEQQCRGSLSAHVYLNKCFLTYTYHSNSNSSSPGQVNNNSNSTKRLAAIVVGGGVAVCLGLIFLFFLRSRYSKHDYYY